MVCKEDVVSWFNELESYKRIETMCTLLNMCLPFELRFLGTCIEGLGRRDFQLLRGVSHSVNTAKELTAIYDSCLTGGPSDQRIRRKLALYVALLRFGKIDCVNDLFRVLAGWDFNDLLNVPSGIPLEEILLLYTLAHWHPVFNFEQRQHCGNIVKRLTEERLPQNSMGQHAQGGLKNLSRPFTQMPVNSAEHIPLVIPAAPISNSSLLNTVPHHTHSVTNIQVGSDVSPVTNISPISNNSSISSVSSGSVSSTGVTAAQSAQIVNESLLPGGHLLKPIMTSRAEIVIPHGPWSKTTPPVVSALGPHAHTEQVPHNSFNTTPSPMLSQSDSPVHSRAGSPNNLARTNNPRSIHVNRLQRRPSNDPTPPPPVILPLAPLSAPTITPMSIPHVTASAVVSTQDNQTLITQTKDFIRLTKGDLTKVGSKHLRNLTLHEVSHMDEDKIGIPVGTMNELRTIVNCNGYCISNCTNPIQNHSSISMNRAKHCHPPPVTYCASQLQALRLDADSSLHQSSASESGSSGSAGHSPPDTPALGSVSSSNSNRTKERCRLNGRPEKSFTRPTLNETSNSGPTTVGMTVTSPYYIQHHFSTSTRSMYGFSHPYRPHHPPPIPFQTSPNGDVLYPYAPHTTYLHPVPVYTPAGGSSQRSCYNCGGTGHFGVDCKELTMEEIARPGLYQLDYTATGATPTPDLATDK